MRVLAISGSSQNGTTNEMIRMLLDEGNPKHEIIQLSNHKVRPCQNCKGCHKDGKCKLPDDMQRIYPKLEAAELIILATPTYFDNVSGTMKIFIDRCLPYYFSKPLAGKKAILLTIGGFPELVEFDGNNNCVWCQQDQSCERTVRRCLDALSYYANHMGFEILEKIFAIHGDPTSAHTRLETLKRSVLIH